MSSFLKLHVIEISPGDRLKHDIFNQFGVLILHKGTELTNDAIVKLMQHGIDYIDIEPRTIDIERTTNNAHQDPVMKVAPLFNEAVDGYEDIFLEALSSGTFDESKSINCFSPW